MTMNALAKKVVANENNYNSWDVISMHARLFKIFTNKNELAEFLLEYARFGWKVESVEEDEKQPHKLVIWLTL